MIFFCVNEYPGMCLDVKRYLEKRRGGWVHFMMVERYTDSPTFTHTMAREREREREKER